MEIGPFLGLRGEESPQVRDAGRPWLLPINPLYWAAGRMHRFYMRAARGRPFRPEIPLVVIGALRAGGSGKTSVTLELARHFRARGLRIAILAYRLGSRPAGEAPGPGALLEVGEDTDWRHCSEEAVMLRRATGARVFATRNRWLAWKSLHDPALAGDAPFDLILSDDGFQDPRLDGAFRILLEAPGESPGLRHLLPAGSFRETRAGRRRAHMRLAGPYPLEDGDAGGPEIPRGFRFHRGLVLPEAGGHRPWIAVCGLGDNRRFVDDLVRAGIRPVAVLEARDHAVVPAARLAACAARFPEAGFLCTRKDYVKLEAGTVARFGFFPVEQTFRLDPAVFPAIEAYRAGFPRPGILSRSGDGSHSPNLVH